MKVLTVIGTRPEAIKMAPVVAELQRQAEERLRAGALQPEIDSRLLVTSQHRELLAQVLDVFHLAPHYDLDVMRPDQSPTAVLAAVLDRIQPILADFRPDWVLVQGDTTTVLAAALAAAYAGLRVGHVEAGLRTYDRRNPFPEETNRVLVDHLSDLCFAPTQVAADALRAEGIPPARVHVTGNTVIDALYHIVQQPPAALPGQRSSSPALPGPQGSSPALPGPQGSSPALPGSRDSRPALPPGKRLLLVTAHRRENHGAPLLNILAALRRLAQRDDVLIVYPVHPNPNVREPAHRTLGGLPNICLLEPQDYMSFVQLMKQAYLILTDSGGIQEEAPALGIPVLVLRETSERPEALETGVVRLVGADTARIVAEATRLLDDPAAYAAMARRVYPYGDGAAARRIVDILSNSDDATIAAICRSRSCVVSRSTP